MSRVTVALQFYNARLTLAAAVTSILNQSFRDWELLLQDDGSTDGSLEIARSVSDQRVTVLSDGVNKRRPARINEALRRASGKYFALMDADDVAYPERLAQQVAFLDREPGVDLLGSAMLVFEGAGQIRGKRVGPTSHEQICRKPWAGFPLAHPTFMGRIEWFRRFGYDERMTRSQDQDLLMRSYRHSRFENLPEVLLGYREESLSARKQIQWRLGLAKALAREFLRQSRPIVAAWALVGQASKAGVDLTAMLTGLGYRILQHRARPVSAEEQRAWGEVWRSVGHGRANATTTESHAR